MSLDSHAICRNFASKDNNRMVETHGLFQQNTLRVLPKQEARSALLFCLVSSCILPKAFFFPMPILFPAFACLFAVNLLSLHYSRDCEAA